MNSHKILIVEDDSSLRETLKYTLLKESYQVVMSADGIEGLETARREKPALIILDVMLPGMSGFEVCRILRRETTVPIIMLTAKTEETDKIVGLEIGADDYITKPFSIRELLARVRAMLRRAEMAERQPGEEASLLKINELEIDLSRHRVSRDGTTLELTPKEYDLLVFLASNRGFVFNREQLLEKVWGYDYTCDNRTVDVHIRWLRRKIEADPHQPKYFITVRGTGYKLEG